VGYAGPPNDFGGASATNFTSLARKRERESDREEGRRGMLTVRLTTGERLRSACNGKFRVYDGMSVQTISHLEKLRLDWETA